MCVHKYLKNFPHFYVVIKSNNIVKVSNKGCCLTRSEIGDAYLPSSPPKNPNTGTIGCFACMPLKRQGYEVIKACKRDSPKPWG